MTARRLHPFEVIAWAHRPVEVAQAVRKQAGADTISVQNAKTPVAGAGNNS